MISKYKSEIIICELDIISSSILYGMDELNRILQLNDKLLISFTVYFCKFYGYKLASKLPVLYCKFNN